VSDDPVRLIDSPDTPAYLVDLVRSLEPPPLPPSVRDRALGRTEPRRQARLAPWLLAAAAIFLGVGTLSLLEGEQGSAPVGKIVNDDATTGPTEEHVAIDAEEVRVGQPPAPPPPEPIDRVTPRVPESADRVAPWADGGVDGSLERVGIHDVMLRCFAAYNYSRCIIRSFAGRDDLSAMELEALTESYRTLRNERAALRHMRLFVTRFPGHPRSREYGQMLVAAGEMDATDLSPAPTPPPSAREGWIPSRADVLAGARSVADRVRACGDGEGVVNVTFTIEGATGRVIDATVTGQYARTPIAECAERAIRTARFPTFDRATFQVTFPYRL
jgi:hypothetical protein